MAASWVAICNRALIRLGTKTIVQLDPPLEHNAELCNEVYRDCADEVLTDHEFACAKKRQALNPLAAAPAGVLWAYQYQLPVDFLKLREVDPASDYQREGDVVLSNESALTVVYSYQVTDPTALDVLVRKAISASIAVALAGKVVQHPDLRFIQTLEGEYERAAIRAKWAERKNKSVTEIDELADQTLPDRWEEVH